MSEPSPTYVAFAEHFGADQGDAIMAAAVSHENGVHDNRGSDSFRWALCIAIGYQCFEVDRYRAHHGITAPNDDVVEWIKAHVDLRSHDGDVDFLAMMGGKYDEYLQAAEATS